VIEREPAADERGTFARVFDAEEFASRGLMDRIAQSSISTNTRAGTLRGLHLQRPPHAERKLVRCTKGSLFDVVVDLRSESPEYGRWYGAELTPDNGRMIHVPEGCAHGFQTLADDTHVGYEISVPFVPEAADGVRWDDPTLGIDWPDPPDGGRIISARDTELPLLGDSSASR
jgi:dTDP-4-dehydrorhamnose 3,5-epimerase